MTLRWRWDAGLVVGTFGLCVISGLLVSRGQALVPAALIAMAGVFLAGLSTGPFLLAFVTIAALLEPPLGNVGPIPSVNLAEVAVPLLLFAAVMRDATGQLDRGALHAGKVALSPPARLLRLVVGVYMAVVLINVARSEFFLETTHALRPLYAYILAFGVYYLTYVMVTRTRNTVPTLLNFVFLLCVVICLIGVTAVAFHLPLNAGTLHYSVYDYTSGAVRVGFLEVFGGAGLALVAVGIGRFRLPAGFLFAVALVASGGRSAALGVAVGILLYLVINRRGWPLLATAAVALSLPFALPSLEQYAQVQRITNINRTAVTSDARALYYSESLRDFYAHPLLGTGFGVPHAPVGYTPDEVAFYSDQLQYGGHGTYHSLLKNFGLVGFLPFVGALLIALWQLAKVTRFSRESGFFFIFLTAQAVAMTVGGNGSELSYFFALGGATAVLAQLGDGSLAVQNVAEAGPKAASVAADPVPGQL